MSPITRTPKVIDKIHRGLFSLVHIQTKCKNRVKIELKNVTNRNILHKDDYKVVRAIDKSPYRGTNYSQN